MKTSSRSGIMKEKKIQEVYDEQNKITFRNFSCCSFVAVRLFIENNGTSLDNCRPKIYTDSEALAFLENAELTAKVECTEKGVIIRVFR